MACAVVDRVECALGRRPTTCRTALEPLVGGAIADVAREIERATRATGDGVVAERLVHAYGSEWPLVWSLVEDEPALRERVSPDGPYLLAELRHAVKHEQAFTLGDLLIRRTPVAFETSDHGREAARRVAPQVARWLGWSQEETRVALAAYDAEAARIFTIERGTG
jgi:glycerol-3-phosphate dehydrogenase